MNIYKKFNEEEINLIAKIKKIEDRDYTKEETMQIENNIIEYIFSRSSKNGDIQKANEDYSNILEKLEKINS
jgi:hypothetical protein